MIQSLPYQDLVDLSLFEGPLPNDSQFSAPAVSDIRPGPRIEITSWEDEPLDLSSNSLPPTAASCRSVPSLDFDYQIGSYCQPSSARQESNPRKDGNAWTRIGKIRRNNQRDGTWDLPRTQPEQSTVPTTTSASTATATTRTTTYSSSYHPSCSRVASDPCLNSHRSVSGGRLVWCSERESWLFTYPTPAIQRPATSNGDEKPSRINYGSRSQQNGHLLTEYYNDTLPLEEPPPPYERHFADQKTTPGRPGESQWSRIAQRVRRSPR
jgi:hypothetical protein